MTAPHRPRVLAAEARKVRGSAALPLAALAPLAIVALYVVLVLLDELDPAERGWAFVGQGAVMMWTSFLLPLLVALLAAVLARIEHDAGGWTRAFSEPVPRARLYLAKLGVLAALVALGSGVLAVGLALTLAGLDAALAPGPAAGPVPSLGTVLGWTGRAAVAVLPLLALHHALSARRPGLALPIGLAYVATMAAQFASGSDGWVVWPWAYPMMAVGGADPNHRALALGLAVAVGAAVAAVGAWDAARRDVV